MKNRWLLTFLLSFSLFAQEGTQLTVFNDHQFQPEVYSFPKLVEAGVDAGGDLNLSIPVLTVPGRGGLDYQINFSYQSSIRVDAQASWIGLGWNFDPGSITRDVKGHTPDQKGINASGNEIVLFGPDYNHIPLDQPDAYFVNIPGKGTFEMARASKTNFNNESAADEYFLGPKNENGFYFVEYEPFKVDILETMSVEANGPQDDIKRFMITTDDGMRYIYGHPTLGKHFDLSYSTDTPLMHVNTWVMSL